MGLFSEIYQTTTTTTGSIDSHNDENLPNIGLMA